MCKNLRDSGIFLAFQYPVELPGVSNMVFLRHALNSVRSERGEEELDPLEFDDYVRDVAGGGAASELEKAAALHNSGKVSDEEYAALKAKIAFERQHKLVLTR